MHSFKHSKRCFPWVYLVSSFLLPSNSFLKKLSFFGTMQGLGIAIKGFEDISALEVKELLGKTAKIEERVVIFDATAQDLALLSYRTQSLSLVLGLLGTCTIDTDLEKTKKNLDALLTTIPWNEWLNGRTFRAK